MIAALVIAAALLLAVFIGLALVNHCLSADHDADPMEACCAALDPVAVEEMDATSAYAEACNPDPMLALRTHHMTDAGIKRRAVIGVGFVLAMICLSAWVGAR